MSDGAMIGGRVWGALKGKWKAEASLVVLVRSSHNYITTTDTILAAEREINSRLRERVTWIPILLSWSSELCR